MPARRGSPLGRSATARILLCESARHGSYAVRTNKISRAKQTILGQRDGRRASERRIHPHQSARYTQSLGPVRSADCPPTRPERLSARRFAAADLRAWGNRFADENTARRPEPGCSISLSPRTHSIPYACAVGSQRPQGPRTCGDSAAATTRRSRPDRGWRFVEPGLPAVQPHLDGGPRRRERPRHGWMDGDHPGVGTKRVLTLTSRSGPAVSDSAVTPPGPVHKSFVCSSHST